MTQLIITTIIIALAATYAGYKIYMTLRGKSSPCEGCEGCALKDGKTDIECKKQKKDCCKKK